MSKKQATRSRGRGRDISISQTASISTFPTSSTSERISSYFDSPSLIIQSKKSRVLILSEMPICHFHTTEMVTFATATSLRSQHDSRVSATTSTSSLRVYCAYTASMEMPRPSRPTAFHVRSPNLGVCFEHAQNKRRDSAIICNHGDNSTMSGVSTVLLLRLWRAWHTLGTISIAVEAQ